MTRHPSVRFSHIGIHVHDLDAMEAFYSGLLGLEVTDRGKLPLPGDPRIVFLSSDPSEHHQIALVEGREDGGIQAGVVNQISFHLESLAQAAAQGRFTPGTLVWTAGMAGWAPASQVSQLAHLFQAAPPPPPPADDPV